MERCNSDGVILQRKQAGASRSGGGGGGGGGGSLNSTHPLKLCRMSDGKVIHIANLVAVCRK